MQERTKGLVSTETVILRLRGSKNLSGLLTTYAADYLYTIQERI